MTSIKKVFGIISYFPNNDSQYHIETRRERSRRCSELLLKLEELWPDIDIMIIAQNWQDYKVPFTSNTTTVYHYDRLGILGARKELRRKFLESTYDYLIMLDDDARIFANDSKKYMAEIDEHPDGFGVIRKKSAPLNMCAVSKYVYSVVDMPDVDPEKSEGYEDDLFVATCFAMFPDKSFMFSKDTVDEKSLHYNGPGACPSSWAREREYDWSYMRKLTDARMQVLTNKKQYSDKDFEPCVDAVIPYVNSADNNWISDFVKATGNFSTNTVRFRCWGTFKYLIRGIDMYMPFVKRIILILARESQVPVWLDKSKVKIVYHKDFIPKQHLPTFNSCTIESFLWNIPDLSERFIYFNDDMFPLNQMGLSDFFDGNTPHILFNEHIHINPMSMFEHQCRATLDTVCNALKAEKYVDGEIVRPEHSATPMLKSTLTKVHELCGDAMTKSVSRLRRKENLNQYIYSYYQYYTKAYVPEIHRFLYVDMKNDLSYVRPAIINSEFQIVCLNDSDKIKDYKKSRQELIDILEEKFPDKCKYEI